VASYAHHDEWQVESLFVRSTFATPGLLRVRFVASDNPNDSRTEAAVDAVKFLDVQCGMTCTRGDANGDGYIDGRDVSAFIAAVLSPPAPEAPEFCAADVNGDAALTVAGDVPLFVDCLLTGVCP